MKSVQKLVVVTRAPAGLICACGQPAGYLRNGVPRCNLCEMADSRPKWVLHVMDDGYFNIPYDGDDERVARREARRLFPGARQLPKFSTVQRY